jgi:transcriptional regulator with XRE-family HTH domain
MEVITSEKAKRNIAANLTRMMREKHITQVELAEAVKEHQSFISRICRGENVAGVDVMLRIAEHLETTIEILAKDPPPPKLARAS